MTAARRCCPSRRQMVARARVGRPPVLSIHRGFGSWMTYKSRDVGPLPLRSTSSMTSFASAPSSSLSMVDTGRRQLFAQT